MTNFKKTLLASALLASVASVANAAEVSGNVTLTNDYRFRGISQTSEDMAIQGGFDVAFDSGIYVGTWASNVDFNGQMELDYYVGYAGDISEDVSYDVGYIYYDYPGTTDTEFDNSTARDDFQEIYASLSFGDLTVGFAYSDDYWLESGEFQYYYADYSFSLPAEFSLDLHYGYNSFDVASDDGDSDAERSYLSDGEDSYSDWSITLGKTVAGLDLAVSWVETDLDDDSYYDAGDLADGTVLFSVSKSM